MATHGSVAVRTLRRNVASIVNSSERQVNKLSVAGGNSSSIPPAVAEVFSQMAARLAALNYPSQYQSAAQAMVTQTQSLAASLRSGQVNTNTGNALLSAVDASQHL